MKILNFESISTLAERMRLNDLGNFLSMFAKLEFTFTTE